MLKTLHKIIKWARIVFITALLFGLTFAMIQINRDMNEHGFWQVYGDPRY